MLPQYPDRIANSGGRNTKFSNNPRIGFLSGCIAMWPGTSRPHRESSELDGSSSPTFEWKMRGANQQVPRYKCKKITLCRNKDTIAWLRASVSHSFVDQDEPSRTLDSLRCSLIKTPSEGYWGTPCFLTARIRDATWLVGQHSDVPSTRATSLIMSRMRVSMVHLFF
jgi:hypothetical protein